MSEDKKQQLRNLLNDTHQWPSIYLFKFILKGENKKIAQVESLFGDTAVISTKESSGGKYISISVREVMVGADEVLRMYDEARKIEGVTVL